MLTVYPVLSIAGSDSSGGAGIQADIKTISAIGCYAMTAITAITAQNTCGLTRVDGIAPEMVMAQLDTVQKDILPLSIKIGMLYDAATVNVVADFLESCPEIPVVLDPVMVSTSGSLLISENAADVMIHRLFPLATLVTPNQSEVQVLTGLSDHEAQIAALHSAGIKNVLIKGGDTERDDIKIDYLSLSYSSEPIPLVADAIKSHNTHGTGCTLSSAIASYLALGYSLEDATRKGKLFVTKAIEAGTFLHIGHGHGPVNHLFSPRKMKIRNARKK